MTRDHVYSFLKEVNAFNFLVIRNQKDSLSGVVFVDGP